MVEESRTCLYFNVCGKTEIYTGRWKEHWHPYQDGYICKSHYGKLIGYKKRDKERRQKYNAKFSKRKIQFKNRSVIVEEDPKTGYCSWCPNNIHDESCKITNMHHYFYMPIMVWACTVEICASCHGKETMRLKERIDRSNRFCLLCGSKTTYHDVKKERYHWTKYKDGHICNVCYSKINYSKYYKKKKE